MKHLKAFWLAVLTVAALVAVAATGSASATELTCTELEGTKVMCPTGTMIQAEAAQPFTLHSPIGDVECKHSGYTAHTTTTGGTGITVQASLTALTFSECNAEVVVLKQGGYTIHTTSEIEGANHNGTVTTTGTEITVGFLGTHCIFATSETDFGHLTGSTTTGGTPTFDLAASMPRTGGRSGVFCGSTAQVTGDYKITEPDWMNVD
jgi:hypothetical protein